MKVPRRAPDAEAEVRILDVILTSMRTAGFNSSQPATNRQDPET
jgi:hypothetical protein